MYEGVIDFKEIEDAFIKEDIILLAQLVIKYKLSMLDVRYHMICFLNKSNHMISFTEGRSNKEATSDMLLAVTDTLLGIYYEKGNLDEI